MNVCFHVIIKGRLIAVGFSSFLKRGGKMPCGTHAAIPANICGGIFAGISPANVGGLRVYSR